MAEAPTADPTGFVAGFADATGRFLPLVCTLNAARVLTCAATMLGTDHAGLDEPALSARPAAGGLTLLPYLDGERTPDLPDANGTLGGLTRANLTPANVAAPRWRGCSAAWPTGSTHCAPTAFRSSGCCSSQCSVHSGAGGGGRHLRGPRVSAVPGGAHRGGVAEGGGSAGEYVALGAARQAAWVLSTSRGESPDGALEEPPGWSVAAQEVPETGGDWAAEARTPACAGRCTASEPAARRHRLGRVGHHAARAWASRTRLRGWTAVTNYAHQPRQRRGRMNIVVCVKYVPDAQADRTFVESDKTTDRVGVDGLLSELDEYAIEEALLVTEAGEGEVTVLTVGPEQASDALKKALQMGADKAVHVVDPQIHGTDALGTSTILAKAIEKLDSQARPGDDRDGLDRRGHGRRADDARRAAGAAGGDVRVRADRRRRYRHRAARQRRGLADRRGDPAGTGLGHRPDQHAALPLVQGDHGREEEAGRHVVARRPRHRAERGRADAAWTKVESYAARPPRQKGQIVADEGDGGGEKLAAFLAERKFV